MKTGWKIAALAAAMMIYLTGTAAAAKVGYIESEADMAYHAQHLEQHLRGDLCTNTGEHVLLRKTPGDAFCVGRMEPGERLRIIDLFSTWAKIEIMQKTPENDESGYGMVGWISVEYIDCGCDAAAYHGEATPDEAR